MRSPRDGWNHARADRKIEGLNSFETSTTPKPRQSEETALQAAYRIALQRKALRS
jgi:hypothetical protein